MNTLNINEAKAITLQYLIQKYGEIDGQQLFYNEKNIFGYHGLAWRLGRENLHYFCEIFLHNLLFDHSGDKIPLSQKHYEIWDELQDMMLNKKNTKIVYVMPRGFGKTSTINIPLAIWTALYCFHPLTVLQSSIAERAENFIEDIKIQIEENQYITSCFGEVINKDLKYNAQEIELDIKPQRTKIKAVSAKTNIRGINYGNYRIGLLLEDDGQSDDDLNTEESRAAVVRRFDEGAMKAMQSQNFHIVALGTVQKIGDLYDTLLNRPSWKAHIDKCVPIDDIDNYFLTHKHWMRVKDLLLDRNNPSAQDDALNYYYDNQSEMDYPVIWEKFQCYQLFTEWLDDRVSFKKEYQCDIKNLGEKRIHSLGAVSYVDIENMVYTNTILSIDPAATNEKKSDYYAFCVLSKAENNLKYCRKAKIKKMEFDDYIETVIKLLLQYTDIDTLSIEKNVYMGADVSKIREIISQHPELRNRTLNIINKSRTKNKDNRINAIIPDINMGRIIFCEDDEEAIAQIKEFAGCAYTLHDDMLDALSDAVENLANAETIPTLQVLPLSAIGL